MRTFTFLIFLLAAFASTAQSPTRTCGAMDILEQQLQSDPGLGFRMDAIERHTEAFERGDQVQFRAVVTIPVVFHIVHNGDALGTGENISDAQVLAQLDQLNQDFRKLNADAGSVPSIFQGLHADTEIQFCLAQRKPDGTPTDGINRIQRTNSS